MYQDRTAKKRQQREDKQEKTAKKGEPGKDCQDGTLAFVMYANFLKMPICCFDTAEEVFRK
jgi:hypothetical protein